MNNSLSDLLGGTNLIDNTAYQKEKIICTSNNDYFNIDINIPNSSFDILRGITYNYGEIIPIGNDSLPKTSFRLPPLFKLNNDSTYDIYIIGYSKYKL
jgi:hypothetical protein